MFVSLIIFILFLIPGDSKDVQAETRTTTLEVTGFNGECKVERG